MSRRRHRKLEYRIRRSVRHLERMMQRDLLKCLKASADRPVYWDEASKTPEWVRQFMAEELKKALPLGHPQMSVIVAPLTEQDKKDQILRLIVEAK